MKSDFWDTSGLLALQCAKDLFHQAAEAAFRSGAVAARRSREEFYSAATGRMGVPPAITVKLLAELDSFFKWLPTHDDSIDDEILTAPRRGIQGRILYDAILARVAKDYDCKTIVTANPTHFRHVYPSAQIIDLTLGIKSQARE
ncbi:MAG TPA: PIN domain-containing protein [Verrucomicrobiae bacterium]|jgi:predicted nucleic acid-binding protein|nr:PIN domain-containing protein [Verrucomicrobiae bacterium]